MVNSIPFEPVEIVDENMQIKMLFNNFDSQYYYG